MIGYVIGVIVYLGISLMSFLDFYENFPFVMNKYARIMVITILALCWPCFVALSVVAGVVVLFDIVIQSLKEQYERDKRDVRGS